MTRHDPGNILVVCLANICRSPLVELVLRDRFYNTMEVTVASAGVQATGAPICAKVFARRLDDSWRAAAESHRSQTASIEQLSSANLILTACTSSRGALARLSPESRHRTFTLREAVWLGREYQPVYEDGAVALTAYAEYLDARRAIDGLPAELAGPWRRRSRGDSLSIPDGHNLGAGAHRQTLDNAEELAREISVQIARAPGMPKSPPI